MYLFEGISHFPGCCLAGGRWADVDDLTDHFATSMSLGAPRASTR